MRTEMSAALVGAFVAAPPLPAVLETRGPPGSRSGGRYPALLAGAGETGAR
jgi:hypothetical protein